MKKQPIFIRGIVCCFIGSVACVRAEGQGQEHDAVWTNGNDPPVDLCQIQLFVTRKGEIVLLGGDGYGFVADGQISDALREE